MQQTMPTWDIPADLPQLVAADGMWESERFSPILLTVLGDTIYKGRAIPLSWQTAFAPFGATFDAANKRHSVTDAFGWADLIAAEATRRDAALAAALNSDDTESSACVIWVETEDHCRALIGIVWELIHGQA